jgi:hypothetical protein
VLTPAQRRVLERLAGGNVLRARGYPVLAPTLTRVCWRDSTVQVRSTVQQLLDAGMVSTGPLGPFRWCDVHITDAGRKALEEDA